MQKRGPLPRRNLLVVCVHDVTLALDYRMYIRKSMGGDSPEANLLSAWREAVEHQFQLIYVQFPKLKNKKQNKIFGRSALLRNYACAALYSNMRTCVCDNQVSSYFGVQAPTLEEFMAFARA
jgi:hypothetical protein